MNAGATFLANADEIRSREFSLSRSTYAAVITQSYVLRSAGGEQPRGRFLLDVPLQEKCAV
jgi:hypothetical protein